MPRHHVISWYYYFIRQDQDIAPTTHCYEGHIERKILITWDHRLTSVFLGRALVTEEELGKTISWPWHSFQLGPLAILLLFRVWFPSVPHAVVLCNDSRTTVTTYRDGLERMDSGEGSEWERGNQNRGQWRGKESKPEPEPKTLRIRLRGKKKQKNR